VNIKFHIAKEYFDITPQIAINKQGRSMGPECVWFEKKHCVTEGSVELLFKSEWFKDLSYTMFILP